jgi:hypothetical protein
MIARSINRACRVACRGMAALHLTFCRRIPSCGGMMNRRSVITHLAYTVLEYGTSTACFL